MSTEIVLQNVILSYPHLITPWTSRTDKEPNYNCAFICPPDWQQWPQLQDCVNCAIANKFGANVPQNLKLPWLNRFLQPSQVKDGPYVGWYVINSVSDRKPELLDQNVQVVPDMKAKGEFFAGCFVNAFVNFYGYANSGNVGVGTGLRKIQMVDNTSDRVIRLGEGDKPASEVFQAIPGAPAPTAPPGAPVTPGAPGGSNPPW